MLLAQELSLISKEAWLYTRKRLTHPYLSNQAYNILGIIYINEKTNQDNIALSLNMDKSSVAKIVSKLEEDKLLTRSFNPNNRREYILSLTSLGIETISELLNIVTEWQDLLLSKLNKTEKEEFLEIIKELHIFSKDINQ